MKRTSLEDLKWWVDRRRTVLTTASTFEMSPRLVLTRPARTHSASPLPLNLSSDAASRPGPIISQVALSGLLGCRRRSRSGQRASWPSERVAIRPPPHRHSSPCLPTRISSLRWLLSRLWLHGSLRRPPPTLRRSFLGPETQLRRQVSTLSCIGRVWSGPRRLTGNFMGVRPAQTQMCPFN
jgi:hypothetical protein